METTLTTIAGYAMKMAITLSLLYIPYIFLLKKETHFRTARTTLLATLLLSITIPFIDIPALHIEIPYTISANRESPAAIAEAAIPEGSIMADTHETEISSEKIVYYVLVIPYIIITIIILSLRTREITRIRSSINRGTLWIEIKEKYTIHCHAAPTPPYSWMNHIVISQEDYDRYGSEIILHEEGHITHRHSWDMLLLTLVEALQWFNPFVHMLASDLKDIHEYEADAYVLQRRGDTKAYQMLIIKKAVDHASYTLVNSFNHSKIKKRITMMLKKKSNPWRRATALYILPATAIALSLFASPQEVTGTESIQPAAIVNGKVSENVEISDTVKGKIFQVCEKAPEFPGGVQALMQHIYKNVEYPDEARKQNKQGKSIVHFVVEADGSISNVKIMKSAGDEQLDKEAMRVVSSMPKWAPGTQGGEAVRVQFTIPIAFFLNTPAKQEQEGVTQVAMKISEEGETTYKVCEKMPEFPGGVQALMQHIYKNVEYPDEARKQNKQGKSIVHFVVEADGSISNVKIMKSAGDEQLDKEAMRVASSMPKWTPGSQRGKAVRVEYTLPIFFRLQ